MRLAIEDQFAWALHLPRSYHTNNGSCPGPTSAAQLNRVERVTRASMYVCVRACVRACWAKFLDNGKCDACIEFK